MASKIRFAGVLLFSIVLALSLVACGGGGGSSSGGGGGNPTVFNNASLSGVYYSSTFNKNNSDTAPTTSSIEKLTFDGNGNFTVDQIFGRSSGANQTQSGSGTYTVNADGTFTITFGPDIVNGRLSADAKTFVTARVNSTTTQNISTGVKQ